MLVAFPPQCLTLYLSPSLPFPSLPFPSLAFNHRHILPSSPRILATCSCGQLPVGSTGVPAATARRRPSTHGSLGPLPRTSRAPSRRARERRAQRRHLAGELRRSRRRSHAGREARFRLHPGAFPVRVVTNRAFALSLSLPFLSPGFSACGSRSFSPLLSLLSFHFTR